MKQDVLADSGYHAANWKSLFTKRASPITSVQATGSGATGALAALIWKAEVGKKDPSQKKERDKG